MDQPDIESVPTPAVKNLRSKFEHLAVPSPSPLQTPVSPSGKRPPPPPPPGRGVSPSRTPSRGPSPSPSASPLLKSSPAPSVSGGIHPSPLVTTLGLPHEQDDEPPEILLSVAALRSKFMSSPPQSVPAKPSVPLRTPKTSSEPLIPIISSSSPEESLSSSSSTLSLSIDDPFTDDATDSATDPDSSATTTVAPPLPARKSLIINDASVSSPRLPPPRPPRHHHHDRPVSVSSPSTLSGLPPPLPVRRTTVAQAEDIAIPSTAPKPPLRSVIPPPPPHASHPNASHQALVSVPHSHSTSSLENFSIASPVVVTPTTASERKVFNNLPPPPTRIINLGDKLPPLARRAPSGNSDSSDDSGDEDDDELEGAGAGLRGPLADLLPDSSRSSRRPPFLFPENPQSGIRVPAHTGYLAVSGGGRWYAVGNGHHVKVWDMSFSHEYPVWDLDTREVGGGKEGKVCAVEFRSRERLWVGMKEGGLFEVYLGSGKGGKGKGRVGVVTGKKMAAHLHPIVWIFSWARRMVTVDESGKVLVFSPKDTHPYEDDAEDDGGAEDLLNTTPRVIRVTDKLEFAKIIGGKLWTAARSDQHGAGTTARTPIVRIYDIFNGAINPVGAGRTVIPTEHVGPVTSATELPTTPGYAYLGHEEGYITIWALNSSAFTSYPTPSSAAANVIAVQLTDDIPRCVEVMKVSSSDVMSLEGVHDKLWAGGRNGFITAYDVKPRPWIVTNCWCAHPPTREKPRDGGTGTSLLPVNRIILDRWGLGPASGEEYGGQGRLAVISVGRNETVGIWDGLLKADWEDGEVEKREVEFSGFRDLKVLIVSWNCDSARPDALSSSFLGDGHDLEGGASAASMSFLSDALRSVDSPDVISFGLQEVIDLESRKMAAKNVLLGNNLGLNKKKEESYGYYGYGYGYGYSGAGPSSSLSASGIGGLGATNSSTILGLSDKVTGAYKRWFDHLMMAVRLAMPPECPYSVIHTESMVGLFTCIFVKNSERAALKDLAINTVKRGMGGRYGNKGGIISRFVVEDSSICFVNCHLAAGQHAVRTRNADVAAILEEKMLFPPTLEPLAFVGGGDGSMVMDHEIIFVNGDMNYRIDQRRDAIVAAVRAGEHETMLAHDQLLKEIKYNRGCRFRFFSEGHISFAPTYKYDRRSDEYDTSEKRRSPAWCDRVLWRARVPGRVQQLSYRRYEADVSDHRPISSAFSMRVKRVRHEVRQRVKAEVQAIWLEEQEKRLAVVREFYRNVAFA